MEKIWTQIIEFLRPVIAQILERTPEEETKGQNEDRVQKEVGQILQIRHEPPEEEPDNVVEQDVVEVPSPVEKPAEEELSSEPEAPQSVCSGRIRMGELSESIREENVRELVCDRIEQITRRLEDWGVEMADSLAELESLRSDDEFDGGQLKKICLELRRQLESLDCKLIDLDEWDPEKQRAIRVEEGLPPGGTPRITRKVSLGLCVQGRLVRKQEVYIKK